jgi:basic membrane lipoprotein Med (substrate-binding protein (PBP1-ABC) superfamily)
MSWRRSAAVVVLLLGFLAACTTGGPSTAPSPSPTPVTVPSPTTASAGRQLAIVLPPATTRSTAQVAAVREEAEQVGSRYRDELPSVRILQPDTPEFSGDITALLAERGADLVCVLGPGAGAVALAVAPSFPQTRFCAAPAIAEPEGIPANVLLVDLRVEEIAFLAGAAAQLASVDGSPGFLAGEAQYDIDRQRAAFTAGINAVADEPVTPYVGFPVSDADRALQLAAPQYAGGVDTIYTVAGDADAGVRRAAQREGGLVIGSILTVVPEPTQPPPVAVLMTTTQRLGVALGLAVEQLLGTWEGGLASVGLAEGALGVAGGGSGRWARVAPAVADLRGRIESRELRPLSGG